MKHELFDWEYNSTSLSVNTGEQLLNLNKYKPGTVIYTYGYVEELDEVHIQRSIISNLQVSWSSDATLTIQANFFWDKYARNYSKYEENLVEEVIIADDDGFLTEKEVLDHIHNNTKYSTCKIKKLYLEYPEKCYEWLSPNFSKATDNFVTTYTRNEYFKNFQL